MTTGKSNAMTDSIFKYLIACHKFFLAAAPEYLADSAPRWKYYAQFPFAYVAFMWESIKVYRANHK